MPTITPTNRLLESLTTREHKKIFPHYEPVELAFGTVLCEAGQPFEHVYFPLTAFISLVIAVDMHPPLEMGLIGDEGMLGATLVLGVKDSPMLAVVQGPGSALRMKSAQFWQLLREHPPMVRTLKRYLYVLMSQLSQTTACTRFHEVEARLARWLLLTHDRAHADHFHLTHQYLADMLGVQRSAVTIAAGVLQQRELISYTRGEINILDRSGLEGASCGCYDAATRDYTRMFG